MSSKKHGRVAVGVLSMGVVAALLSGPAQAAGTWGPTEPVTPHVFTIDEPESAQVEVDGNGGAVVAWLQDAGDDQVHIWAARRIAGGAWLEPAAVTDNPIDPYEDQWDVAISPTGKVAAVWQRTVSGVPTVELADNLGGSTWAAPVVLGQGTQPRVVLSNDGATVLWARGGVRARTRPDGGFWSDAKQVATKSSSFLSLATNADGDVVAAWLRLGDRAVRASLKPAGGSWRPVKTFAPKKRLLTIQSVVSPGGRALVMWQTTGDWDPKARVYRNGLAWARSNAAGDWSNAKWYSRSIGEHGDFLDLSMNSAGKALAVWGEAQGGYARPRLKAARFNGTTWGATQLVAKGYGYLDGWLDDSGRAHLVADLAKLRYHTQAGGSGWSAGAALATGSLGDATGNADRLLMVFYTDDRLMSQVLD